jgi:hypothetical protein
MDRRIVSIPEIGAIAGTRMALGIGIGLLLADHVRPEKKCAIAWTLVAVGILSTIPLAADVLSHRETSSPKKAP